MDTVEHEHELNMSAYMYNIPYEYDSKSTIVQVFALFWLKPKYSIIFFAYVTTAPYSTQQADTLPDGKNCTFLDIVSFGVNMRYWADAN